MELTEIRQPKILAFSGSLRAQSYNKKILDVAARGVEAAGGTVTLVDLADYPMPIYNVDDHEENGFDAHAFRLQELVVAHDGFLIASPSYNGSLTAALKNMIDWMSRPNEQHAKADIFRGKGAAILTASPGSFGGVRMLAHLRDVLTSVGVYVHPTGIAVTFVDKKLDDAGQLQDAQMEDTLLGVGRSLVEMIAQLNHHPQRLAAVNGR